MRLKQIKAIIASMMLTVSITFTTPANALFGIGDVVFDPTQAQNMIQTFMYWKQQYDQMQTQIQQAKTTYESMTGKRGYGGFMNIPYQLRNYLPKNYSDVLSLLNNTNPSYYGIADVIRKYIDANAVLTEADLDSMKLTPAQRRILTDSRSNTAAIQAMANEALQNASVRFNLLQSLAYEINETTDPKAIEELQARISVEQNMMTNEQTKLQELANSMQERKEMIAQQSREVAIQQSGSVSDLEQPDLSGINYGYNQMH